MVNYWCKKFNAYPSDRVHPLRTDERTDRKTDRQMTTMPIAQPLLKYGWLKNIMLHLMSTIIQEQK